MQELWGKFRLKGQNCSRRGGPFPYLPGCFNNTGKVHMALSECLWLHWRKIYSVAVCGMGGTADWISSDQSCMTMICLLKPWVPVPAPAPGQKLELDPCSQKGGRQGQPFPVRPVACPDLGGSEGHIVKSECPAMYWSVAQSRWGQRPTSQLTCIDVLVGEVSAS